MKGGAGVRGGERVGGRRKRGGFGGKRKEGKKEEYFQH